MADFSVNPFLHGVLQMRAANEASSQNDLRGVLGMLQAQQLAQEMPLKQDLLRAQVADLQQKPEDRRNQIENSKQLAMSRLAQTTTRDLAMIADRSRAATTREEKLHWDQQMDVLKAHAQRQAVEIAAGRYNYEIGGAPLTPYSAPAIPQVPGAGGGAGPVAVPAGVLAGRSPAEQQGILSAAGGQPMNIGPYQVPPPRPALGPVAQGAPDAPPLDIPSQLTDSPASMSMRLSGGLEGRFPDVTGGARPMVASNGLPAPLAPAAPAAAPAPGPAAPQMPAFGGSPKQQAADRNKWLLEQSKNAVDVTGPDAKKNIEFWSGVLKNGGSLPPGLARNREGAALVKEVMKNVGLDDKITPQEFMSNQAEFMGEKAGQRTLGTRMANIELAATEASSLSKLALQASQEWNRTGIKTLNDLEKFAQSRTASPELRQFVAANTSFINAYARAINPQGVGTVADKEHAREMLEVGFSKNDYAAAIKQLQSEIGAALASPGQVRQDMRQRFTRGAPGATPAPGMRSSDEDLINKYLKPANGR